jgi:hypothetical protein
MHESVDAIPVPAKALVKLCSNVFPERFVEFAMNIAE